MFPLVLLLGSPSNSTPSLSLSLVLLMEMEMRNIIPRSPKTVRLYALRVNRRGVDQKLVKPSEFDVSLEKNGNKRKGKENEGHKDSALTSNTHQTSKECNVQTTFFTSLSSCFMHLFLHILLVEYFAALFDHP